MLFSRFITGIHIFLIFSCASEMKSTTLNKNVCSSYQLSHLRDLKSNLDMLEVKIDLQVNSSAPYMVNRVKQIDPFTSTGIKEMPISKPIQNIENNYKVLKGELLDRQESSSLNFNKLDQECLVSKEDEELFLSQKSRVIVLLDKLERNREKALEFHRHKNDFSNFIRDQNIEYKDGNVKIRIVEAKKNDYSLIVTFSITNNSETKFLKLSPYRGYTYKNELGGETYSQFISGISAVDEFKNSYRISGDLYLKDRLRPSEQVKFKLRIELPIEKAKRLNISILEDVLGNKNSFSRSIVLK